MRLVVQTVFGLAPGINWTWRSSQVQFSIQFNSIQFSIQVQVQVHISACCFILKLYKQRLLRPGREFVEKSTSMCFSIDV